MGGARLLRDCFSRVILYGVLVFAGLLAPAVSGAAQADVNETDRYTIVYQVAQSWSAVAQLQYERALYKHAEKSLLRAQEYFEYLGPDEQMKINKLLEKIHDALSEKAKVLERIESAEQLAQKSELIKAKAHLEESKKNALLNEMDRQRVDLILQRVNTQLDARKQEMAELFQLSKKYYLDGNLEKAREGFLRVAESGLFVPAKGMTAGNYLVKINELLNGKTEPSGSGTSILAKRGPRIAAVSGSDELVNVAEPTRKTELPLKKEKGLFGWDKNSKKSSPNFEHPQVKEPEREGNVKKSYVKAVVGDSVKKAAEHLDKGRFSKAKAVLENTQLTLQKNRSDIGEDLFRQYNSELEKLFKDVLNEEVKWLGD